MILRERARLVAICTHPEGKHQHYERAGRPWRVCGMCGAARSARGGAWQRPELIDRLAEGEPPPSSDWNARVICAEIDAEDTTKAALVAWRRVQEANAAIAKGGDENARRIALLGENDASAFVAMLSAIIANAKADA